MKIRKTVSLDAQVIVEGGTMCPACGSSFHAERQDVWAGAEDF